MLSEVIAVFIDIKYLSKQIKFYAGRSQDFVFLERLVSLEVNTRGSFEELVIFCFIIWVLVTSMCLVCENSQSCASMRCVLYLSVLYCDKKILKITEKQQQVKLKF